MGDPWQTLAFAGDGVYGLYVHGHAVHKYDGTPMQWTRIGGPYGAIFGGATTLYGASGTTGEFFSYDAPYKWSGLGVPF
jgi:hypothetical protein